MTDPQLNPYSSPQPSPLGQTVEALNALNVIAEGVAGYRATLIKGGIPDATANSMAQEYHSVLMAITRKQILGES